MENSVAPTMSPISASHNLKLLLPLSCDPLGSNNPPKQLVWVVGTSTKPSSLGANLTYISGLRSDGSYGAVSGQSCFGSQ